MYQPLPLNWIAGAEMVFVTAPPHLMHFFSGGSATFWITSKTLLHFEHLYSYIGIGISHMEMPYYTREAIDIKGMNVNETQWLRRCRSRPRISRHLCATLLFGRPAGEMLVATICFLPELGVARDLFGFPLG